MTVVAPTVEAIDNGIVVTWENVSPGDECEKVDVSQYPIRTLQGRCNVVTPTHPVVLPQAKVLMNLDITLPWRQLFLFTPQSTNSPSHMTADASRPASLSSNPELRWLKLTVPAAPTSPSQSFPEGLLCTFTLLLLKS